MKFHPHAGQKDVLVVIADADINASSADGVVAELEKTIDGGSRKMVVDLSRLEDVSSYGMGVLLRLQQKVGKHGGEVKLAGVKPAVAKMFKLLRIESMFASYVNLDAAVGAFGAKTA